KADIGDDPRDNHRRDQSAKRHDAQDAAIAIGDELLKRGKGICRDGRLQDPTIAIEQLQTEAISQQPHGKSDGHAKAEIEDTQRPGHDASVRPRAKKISETPRRPPSLRNWITI